MTAVRYRDDAVEFLRRLRYGLLVGKASDDSKDAAELFEASKEEVTRLDRDPIGPLSRDYLLRAAALVLTILFTGPLGASITRILSYVP